MAKLLAAQQGEGEGDGDGDGNGDGLRRQKFFKILLPGTFESTLCLPPKFAARLGCPAAAAVTLRDPAGRSWDVELARRGHNNQQAACFSGTAWCGFVRANCLAPGHMLVFDRRPGGGPGLHFAVDMFDHSGCLKEEEEEEDDEDAMESGNAAAWRRAFAGGMKKKKKTNNKKRKHSRSPSPPPADTTGSCGQDEQQQQEEEEEEVHQLHIARPYQLMFLDLTKSFCDRVGWTSSRSVELSLIQIGDDDNSKKKQGRRRWEVSVKVSGKGGMICGGWMAFAKDNNLSVNDTCVFKPPPRHLGLHDGGSSSSILQVKLLRRRTNNTITIP